METNTNPNLTETSFNLFIAYAKDAGNWGGTPLVIGDIRAESGNLTQMKKAGLIVAFLDEQHDCWIEFTAAGKDFARQHGVEIF